MNLLATIINISICLTGFWANYYRDVPVTGREGKSAVFTVTV